MARSVIKNRSVQAFVTKAKKLLWRVNRQDFTDFLENIKRLQTEKNYTKSQAAVMAAKEFTCLLDLFKEFDVSQFDPDPTSHQQVDRLAGFTSDHNKPEAERKTTTPARDEIRITGIEGTLRENLNWAMEAAGRFLRTSESPRECPNDSAYYLYRRAVDEPKEFLMRLGQVEGKSADAGQTGIKTETKRSVKELDQMLAAHEENSVDDPDTVQASHP